jgi:carboxyl-terminal processing protease
MSIFSRLVTKEKFQTGTFIRGMLSGACMMFSVGVVFASNNPLYIVGFSFDGFSAPGLSDQAEGRVKAAADRFIEALVLAEENHSDKTLIDDVVSRMLDNALGELDPYSGFMNADQAQSLISMGSDTDTPRLGVSIMDVDGRFVIESVIPGSPAEVVGLMPGDRVVRVNGEYVGDEEPRFVNEIIHTSIEEANGGLIKLGVRRPGRASEILIDIDPEPVRLVGAHNLGRKDGVVHIHLEEFYEGAAEDVAGIIRRENRDADLDGVVLDLRNNGGGLTSEARNLAGLFLPEGALLYEMSGRAVGVKTVENDISPEFPDLRLSLIINAYTASSSEIFAGAIQAHERGKVVGWRSLGKGSIQRVYPVEDGAVKITVAEYKDAGLRKINKVGITPDIPIPTEDPKFRPSRFSDDEARERARNAIASLPYVAFQ